MTQIVKNLLKRIAGFIWYSGPDRYPCTVIVLSWNRANLTIRCLESLMQNSPDGFQILLVDNASDQNEKNLISEHLSQYGGRVGVFWLRKNYGGSAFNFVSWRARGEFVLFCENDLLFSPGWFENMRVIFQLEERLGQLSPLSALPQFEKGEVWTTKNGRLVNKGDGHSYFQSFTNLGTTSMVPRKVLKKGIFWRNIPSGDNKFHFPDDGHFSAQIRNLHLKIGWMEKPQVENLGHQKSEWEKNQEYYLENWKLKSKLGIDGKKSDAGAIEFKNEKMKFEQSSARSHQIFLQRNFPHLIEKTKILPEIGRIYLDCGMGFQVGRFLEFEYFLGEKNWVHVEIPENNVSKIRIDPIDCPALVGIEQIEAQSEIGERISMVTSNQEVISDSLKVENFEGSPEIFIEFHQPIKKFCFNISVQVSRNAGESV